MSNRYLLLSLVALLLLFANMWLAYKYVAMQRQIDEVQARNIELIEENKRIFTALTILQSPQIVVPRAQQYYELELLEQERIIQMEQDTRAAE